MPLKPFGKVTSRTLVLETTDIDTDQIIPARFLTVTTREGLGKHAFNDWRYDESGNETDSVLNDAQSKECEILVAGNNFGCGSSREHAPWALTDYGFRVVISTEIADIFKSNSLKNGLLPIVVDTETHDYLLEFPGVEVTIDLEDQTLSLSNGRDIQFDVEPFAKTCLLQGVDQLGFLKSKEDEIKAYEEKVA